MKLNTSSLLLIFICATTVLHTSQQPLNPQPPISKKDQDIINSLTKKIIEQDGKFETQKTGTREIITLIGKYQENAEQHKKELSTANEFIKKLQKKSTNSKINLACLLLVFTGVQAWHYLEKLIPPLDRGLAYLKTYTQSKLKNKQNAPADPKVENPTDQNNGSEQNT